MQHKGSRRILAVLAAALLIFMQVAGLGGTALAQGKRATPTAPPVPTPAAQEAIIDPQGITNYLDWYGVLPDNFITKNKARDLGWDSRYNYVSDVAPGKSIGGDRFGNYEGTLPEGDYHECDIDTLGAARRGAKRLVYSDDGRIYYTEDHYESFTLLYGEED